MLSKVFLKMAFWIVVVVLVIEGVLLFFSMSHREDQLQVFQNMERTSHSSVVMFTDEFIQQSLVSYRLNILLMVGIIALSLVFSLSYIFQYFVGFYLKKITELNLQESSLHADNLFSKIPNDEIGELISSRKQMLEELKSAISINKRLVRILVHDLNNTLAIIIGSTSLILRPSLAEDKKVTLGENILRAANLQQDLIQKVSDIQAIESNKKEIQCSLVSVKGLLSDVQFVFQDRLTKKSIQLDVAGIDEKLLISIDKVLFSNNVLNNIISNALKFSDTDSTISIKAYENKESVVINILDHGMGMSLDLLDRLFSPSERTTRRGTAGERGTGFGMPLALETVKQFGGVLEVTSVVKTETSQDHGSSFTIILPRVDQTT